jgi:hypothetical protein
MRLLKALSNCPSGLIGLESAFSRTGAITLLLLAGLPLSADTLLTSSLGPGNTYSTSASSWLASNLQVGDPIGFVAPTNSYNSLNQLQVGDELVSDTDTSSGMYDDVSAGFVSSTDSMASYVSSDVEVNPSAPVSVVLADMLSPSFDSSITSDPSSYPSQTALPNPVAETVLSPSTNGTVEPETDLVADPVVSIFALDATGNPEPESVLMVAAGFAAIVFLIFRRRSRSGAPDVAA